MFLWLSTVWFVCVNLCLILLLLLYHYCETIFGILPLSWMCVGGYHPYRNCPLEGGWHARERGWGLSPTRSGAWLGVGGAAVTAAGVPTWHILTNYENFRLKPFWQMGWLNKELENGRNGRNGRAGRFLGVGWVVVFLCLVEVVSCVVVDVVYLVAVFLCLVEDF